MMVVDLMDYIFIDESGDLGSKKSSSKYFVMVGIKVDNPKKLDLIIKKTRQSTKKHMLTLNEIKGSNLPHNLKIKILKKLNNINYQVFIIVFDKFYRYKVGYDCTNKELYDILSSKLAELIDINKNTFVCIDKSKNKNDEIIEFNEKFFEKLANENNFPITIKHANSINYKGLQIADLISWSIFQKFEHGNNEYSDLIENKIIKKVYEN